MSAANAEPARRSVWRNDLALLIALAAVRFALHVLLDTRYGFHRDELQVLDDARHLDWGYVPYPPLTPFLAWIELHLFGTSLAGFRFFSALAQCAAMVLTGLIARELGGRRFAQVFAALAAASMPFSLVMASVFMYSSFDLLWWVAVAYFALRLINSGNLRWWLAIGATSGLGLMTRYTIAICAVGFLAGVVATPLRRHLWTPWPWIAALLALLMFLPNLIWQVQHDFIYLDFVAHIHARDIRWHRTDGFWIEQLFANTGPLLLPLWLAGLIFLVRAQSMRAYRLLAWMYFVALALFALSRGRGYYVAPAYPMLLAAGAVALEQWLQHLRGKPSRAVRAGAWFAFGLSAASSAVVALPLGSIGSPPWRLARAVHDSFAEQIGWPDLAQRVAEIYRSLPESERAHAAILANNYGEAGALDLYGPALGLPRVISRTNTYWYRGYGDPPPSVVIELGNDADDEKDSAAECTSFGRFRNKAGVDNEESANGYEIFVCRNIPPRWPEIWGAKPRFG
jgi:4-amino-4-deoxy-L-arabinose transferase-like glycosyltransferase